MSDESYADDGAVYDVWARLTAADVATIRNRVEYLAHRLRQLGASPVPPELTALAIELRDGPLALGALPVVREAIGVV